MIVSSHDGSEIAILATDSPSLALGLGALLLSIPPIEHVEYVTDNGTLLDSLTVNSPTLIILDTGLAQFADLLRTAREHSPNTLRVLLSDSMTELRELVINSQDTVIIKGADPGRLARTFEYLLGNSAVA